MATGFDRLLRRVPGSTPFKAFAAGVLLCAGLGYPIFYSTNGSGGDGNAGKQGHDLFSQERPEAILQAEQDSRKQYLREREERREQRERQQQQQGEERK